MVALLEAVRRSATGTLYGTAGIPPKPSLAGVICPI
jgi:hypothetical protein